MYRPMALNRSLCAALCVMSLFLTGCLGGGGGGGGGEAVVDDIVNILANESDPSVAAEQIADVLEDAGVDLTDEEKEQIEDAIEDADLEDLDEEEIKELVEEVYEPLDTYGDGGNNGPIHLAINDNNPDPQQSIETRVPNAHAPEPATGVLGIMAAGALTMSRRRRNASKQA